MKTRDLAIVRPETKTNSLDRQKELLEKSAQAAQLLRSDVQELYNELVRKNPLAAELFREQVLTPCAKLACTLIALDTLSEENE